MTNVYQSNHFSPQKNKSSEKNSFSKLKKKNDCFILVRALFFLDNLKFNFELNLALYQEFITNWQIIFVIYKIQLIKMHIFENALFNV